MAKTKKSSTYFEKIESDIKSRQSTMSLVLGALIVLVVGLLIYNYFNKDNTPDLGPSQQTDQQGDVSPENLPGKYTVKEGDTLFIIAEKYYQDGFKFTEIAKANNLTNVNSLEVGVVLDIPKLDSAEASPSASVEPTPTAEASVTPPADSKGAVAPATPAPSLTTNTWGTPITGETYTVVEGDWLSTIAGRAYGDILSYEKIAQANNITNPDLITPGLVLKLPR